MSHQLVIDESLPSRRLANGRSVGVLEGVGDFPAFEPPDGYVLDSLSDLSDVDVVASTVGSTPTHRLRVKLEGPPTSLTPLSGEDLNAVAARLQAQQPGKITVFYDADSPVLTASSPPGGFRNLRAGTPLVFWYEVDVALAPGLDPAKVAKTVARLVTREQQFLGAGFRVLDVIFHSLTGLAGAVGGVVGKSAMAVIQKVWKPVVLVLLVLGGVYFAPTVKALMRPKQTSSRVRRRRR